MTDSPIKRFQVAFDQATLTETFDPSRCALATVGAGHKPSVRFVLVKAVDARGFVFYTNLGSSKVADIRSNPVAELAFHWHTTGVQVRVQGPVEQVTDSEADVYFRTRPRGSQLSAWASHQSASLTDRADLERAFGAAQQRFEGRDIPRPEFWSGFILRPDRVEFWQNRDDRLHERELYMRRDDGWVRTQLQP